MKIHILYSDPYDEGATVYGAFSSEEKAEMAREIFSSKSNHELYIMELDVDTLEKHYERAKNPKKLYYLSRTRSDYGFGMRYGKWRVYPVGLDSFLEGGEESEKVIEFHHFSSANVLADSEEEAIAIVEKMISEGKVIDYDKDNSLPGE
jgi:hypothetical protein